VAISYLLKGEGRKNMRKKTSRILCIALAMLMFSGMLLSLPILPVKAQGTTLSILNPDDTHDLAHVNSAYWTAFKTFDTKHDGTPAGAGDIVFHAETVAGNIFYIRVYLKDAVNVWNWQIKVKFDPTVIEATQAFVPTTSLFNFAVKPTPVIDNATGYVMMGASRLADEPGVSGSGDLASITFQITAAPSMPGESLSCDLTLDPTDTFLLDPDMAEISFSRVDGYYQYTYPLPPYPYLEIKPNIIKAKQLYQEVTIEIWVGNVSEEWQLVGFQFVLGFNTTLLEPINYSAGTFMEGFANDGEWVLYAEGHDYIGDAALPPGYNAWTITIMIMPDGSGLWHAPFPSGNGLLVSLQFNATLDTVYPDEAWTDLNFTYLENYPYTDLDDFIGYAMDVNLNEIPFEETIGANYRAPFTDITGPQITDITQEPQTNVQPDQVVKVTANVTDTESGVKNVTLWYTVDDGVTWESVEMAFNTTTGLWEAEIPGQSQNAQVKYKLEAYDNAENLTTEDNAGEYYTYTVVNEYAILGILLMLTMLTSAMILTKKSKRVLRLIKP